MNGRNIVSIVIIFIVTTLTNIADARILDRTHFLNGTSRLIPQLAVHGNSSITNRPEAIKGISLGGWLVTEPYITPSLYWSAKHASYKHARSNVSIVDEYTMCQAIGQERARYLLTKHYNTWITKKDIQQIRKHGFNLVRIPVGYWAWKQIGSIDRYVNNITYYDPFVGGIQLPYLHRALNWCKDAGLKVWLDLHGAPGSQNGFDNSGQRIFEHEGDLKWLQKNGTRALTVEIVKSMYYDFAGGEWKDVIAGIEVLNEPMGSRLGIGNVTSFYNETIDEFVKSGLTTPLVIHDAFEPLGYWNSYRNRSSDPTIYIDHHHYEVFSYPQLESDHYSRLESVANYGESLSKENKSHQAIVGEWSGAITDCATWLNGIGIGSRYGGTYYDKFENNSKTANESRPALGTCRSQKPIKEWDNSYKLQVRQFIEAQLVSYTLNSKGWIFWNWKTESAPEWDYRALSEHHLFPRPFDNYTYFYQNGTFKDNSSIEVLGTDGSIGIDPTTPKSSASRISARNPLLLPLNIMSYFISHKSAVVLLALGLLITL